MKENRGPERCKTSFGKRTNCEATNTLDGELSSEASEDAKSAEKNDTSKSSKKYKKRKKSKVKEPRDKYHRIVLPKLKLVYAQKRRGLSDEEIAANLGIAYSTFKVYKGKYSELSAALSAGAREAVLYVENALFEKSVGFERVLRKPIKVKEVIYNERGQRQKEIERIEYGEEEVFIPPETNAMKFYLLNRAPDKWAEHREPAQDEKAGGIVFIPKRGDEN